MRIKTSDLEYKSARNKYFNTQLLAIAFLDFLKQLSLIYYAQQPISIISPETA